MPIIYYKNEQAVSVGVVDTYGYMLCCGLSTPYDIMHNRYRHKSSYIHVREFERALCKM